MTTFKTGRSGESQAVDYLKDVGYKILDRNWRNRWCEIDIVAQKGQAIYFVEVKFRRDPAYGAGLEYITKSKLQQMQFAAEMWVGVNNWEGEYRLAAIGIDSNEITFTDDLFV